MKTEKALRDYTKRKCLNVKCLVYKFSSPSRRGVPDDIIIAPGGTVYFAEYKSPAGTGVLSALQKHVIRIFREQGCNVYVIANKIEADNFVKTIRTEHWSE